MPMSKVTFRSIGPEIWAAEMSFSLGPCEIGARSIIARLPDGKLWVHSPIALEPAWRAELEKLGEVAYVVAPNTFHFGHHAEWVAAYPKAKFYALPNVKLPKGGRFDERLSSVPPPEWSDAVQITILKASKLFREAIFCHRASQTLIATDLLFNLPPTQKVGQKIARALMGIPTGPGISRFEKLLLRDKNAAKATLKTILGWHWQRLSMAHGEIIETDAKVALRVAHRGLVRELNSD